jgi:hypothetical protein
MAQRIKGQEVELLLVTNGQVETSLTDIRSFTVTPRLEVKEEQYLGETSMRFDEIFNGVGFDMELHFENAGVLQFIETVKARAQRRTPGTVVNIKATLNFSSGQRSRIILQNCFFSDLPIAFAGRGDYGTLSISGNCTDITRI